MIAEMCKKFFALEKIERKNNAETLRSAEKEKD
jgi:hypothetical protein